MVFLPLNNERKVFADSDGFTDEDEAPSLPWRSLANFARPRCEETSNPASIATRRSNVKYDASAKTVMFITTGTTSKKKSLNNDGDDDFCSSFKSSMQAGV
jgi:hypothetical protein